MTGTGKIVCACPPMMTHSLRLGLRITTQIQAAVTVNMPDGSMEEGEVIFPPVYIRKKGLIPGVMVVDPVTAEGIIGPWGGDLTITLQAERVLGPIALPVQATGSLELPDKSRGIITMTFPAVLSTPQGGGDWLVGAVLAKGEVRF